MPPQRVRRIFVTSYNKRALGLMDVIKEYENKSPCGATTVRLNGRADDIFYWRRQRVVYLLLFVVLVGNAADGYSKIIKLTVVRI